MCYNSISALLADVFEMACDHVSQFWGVPKICVQEGYKSLYICPDRTVHERKSYKPLLDQQNTDIW